MVMGGRDFMNREGIEMKYVIRGIAIAVLGCLLLLVVAEPGLTDENEKCGGYLEKCDTNGNGRITCAEARKCGLKDAHYKRPSGLQVHDGPG